MEVGCSASRRAMRPMTPLRSEPVHGERIEVRNVGRQVAARHSRSSRPARGSASGFKLDEQALLEHSTNAMQTQREVVPVRAQFQLEVVPVAAQQEELDHFEFP